MGFVKAVKRQLKLRMALIGPSGSGKTYTALEVGTHLGERVALLDTEHQSASKYADIFDFDTMVLDNYHPQNYINAIKEAEKCGYDVLIIDSLSHAWMGKDGALDLVDKVAKRYGGNSHAAWKDVTPIQTNLIEAILSAKMHMIVTMRAKMDYVQEKDDRGKTIIRKVGLAPVQRDGVEYEFDVIGDMTADIELIITKTRCAALTGCVINKPGKELADVLLDWLNTGDRSPLLPPQTPEQQLPGAQQTREASPAQQPKPSEENPQGLTEAQVKYIHILGSKKFGKNGQEQFRALIEEIVGRRCSTKLLSKKEASDVIEKLQVLPDFVEPPDPAQQSIFKAPEPADEGSEPVSEQQVEAASAPIAQPGDPDYDPFIDPNIGPIEPDPGEYCDKCRSAIAGTIWNGKPMNALEIVKLSREQSGQRLCTHCLSAYLTAKRKEERQAGKSKTKVA